MAHAGLLPGHRACEFRSISSRASTFSQKSKKAAESTGARIASTPDAHIEHQPNLACGHLLPRPLSCDDGRRSLLVNSELFEQAIVYGDNKPFLVVLLVLSEEKKSLDDKIIKDEIEKINLKLSKIENIKKFFTINEKFSIENGMLTPTLKLKRFKIIQKHKNSFEKLY